MLRSAVFALSALATLVSSKPLPEYEEVVQKLKTRQSTAPPGGQQDGDFTFYQMPSKISGICDLCLGPDGALWGVQQLINQIMRLDPETGEVEEFPIPFSPGIGNITIPGLNGAFGGLIQDRLALSCAIRPGADGKIYNTNGARNQLVQFDPATREFKLFQAPVSPLGNLFPFNDIFTDDGGMWMTQTTANLLQYFDYEAQDFTITVQIPTPLALPLGVFVTSDGGVYGCEVLGNKIFEYKRDTGEVVEYNVPVPLTAPAVNRAERDGFMYFSGFVGNSLGRINLQTKEIEIFPTGEPAAFGSVTAGPSADGDVWMSFFTTTNGLFRFNREEEGTVERFPGLFTSSRSPFRLAQPLTNIPILGPILGNIPPYLSISVEYGPGDAVWFGSFTRNAVGRLQL
ncbi:hypothetical protein CB0940_01292 [Cercospora beticola]|uniref:Virginiamycin B lyase n=1 Tax=Cercospora beticola TaxID=122368 RepID=A0A2G5I6M2_CERBT|nr:hypothetical protein CB0940_01292 [Cercospora beticola]PIB00445.1 hypothetical protein CB0940_01292 [Cercospora beticola]WPA96726.1 hypothetical protein RHO25_001334 [Cercospora beticola]